MYLKCVVGRILPATAFEFFYSSIIGIFKHHLQVVPHGTDLICNRLKRTYFIFLPIFKSCKLETVPNPDIHCGSPPY